MLKTIPGTGIEVGARKTAVGSEVEFKLPWVNFPDFKAVTGAVIALDAELCYSDGAARVNRTFAYGSPLSVQQPASQAKIQLVERLEPAHWKHCAAVMMPLRCDTPWGQPARPQVTGMMAVPPNQAEQIGKFVFRLLDTEGKTLSDFEGKLETFEATGKFQRAVAAWPVDLAAPGTYLLVGLAFDKQGHELARVAPRMVSVQMNQSY